MDHITKRTDAFELHRYGIHGASHWWGLSEKKRDSIRRAAYYDTVLGKTDWRLYNEDGKYDPTIKIKSCTACGLGTYNGLRWESFK